MLHQSENIESMKTTIYTIALSFTLVVLTLSSLKATAFSFKDESYIDDIPFDTRSVMEEMTNDTTMFVLHDEKYIDDIPFDTEMVVMQQQAMESMQVTFEFEEEPYINDIPFETGEVVNGMNKTVKEDNYTFFIFPDLKL